MIMIRYFLYNLLLAMIAPAVMLYLSASRRHRKLMWRFRPYVPSFSVRPIWVHACSVGEVNVAKELVKVLREKDPHRTIMLSVSTLSGVQYAASLALDATVVLAPFDLKWTLRDFIKRTRPCVLAIIETEIWPNLVRETARSGIPVLILNGRISERKFPKYKRYRHLYPPFHKYIALVAAQNEIYTSRFQAIGVDKEKIKITGNMKNDAVVTVVAPDKRDALLRDNGFSKKDTILIFGSTRPGDEQLAEQCWQNLKAAFKDLRIIIAPRHLNRVGEVLQAFSGENICRRTEILAGTKNCPARVFILDTLGELNAFYALATIVVIGGSFYPGVEGHNPLESAALGVPTIFGPFMGNFPEAATLLLNAEGALQVNANELPERLRTLLQDPALRESLANKGRKAVLESQGVVEKNASLVLRYIR
jgi:3-deoxy-D-manno-octulosonic-acid transferase